MENLMKAYKRLLKVAIIGAPNAGKSTLLNRLVNNEISCVSNKVHTTRHNILGVHTENDAQLEFFDSPGIITRQHLLKHRLEDTLYKDPEKAVHKCDIIAVVVDAGNIRDRKRLNKGLLQLLREHSDKQSLLILNKVDLIKEKRQLLDITTRLTQGCIEGKCRFPKKSLFKMSYEELKNLNLIGNLGLREKDPSIEPVYKHVINLNENETGKRDELEEEKRRFKNYIGISESFEDPDIIGYRDFSEIFSISAYNNEGVDEIRKYMLDLAKPVEMWPHGPDYVTNQSTKEIVLGIVRGKVMDHGKHSSPYVVRYKFFKCDYDDMGSLHVNLTVMCPQKYMVGQLIGERGVNIYRIIDESRDLISRTLGCDVELNVQVLAKEH